METAGYLLVLLGLALIIAGFGVAVGGRWRMLGWVGIGLMGIGGTTLLSAVRNDLHELWFAVGFLLMMAGTATLFTSSNKEEEEHPGAATPRQRALRWAGVGVIWLGVVTVVTHLPQEWQPSP